MEKFEEWLSGQGIAVTGQAATGSGDMVRYQLRLPNGAELEIALSAETLVYRPEDAIARVQSLVETHHSRRANGSGPSA